MKNCSQAHGAVGTAADAWSDIANAGALAASMGWPSDSPWYYVFNPYTQAALADVQKGLSAADTLVNTAWQKAQVSRPMAGMQALTGVSLASYTTGAGADRAGAIASAPTQTYASVKDTMTQDIALDSLDASLPIKAGDVIEIVGTEVLSKATRQPIRDAAGAVIPFRAVVTTDVTASLGAATVNVSGPFINEAAPNQYATASLAGGAGPLVGAEVVNILGSASTAYQPNLFYHKDAFTLATVKIPKLFSTDTTAVTKDGFSFRVSKYADGDTNVQNIRFDLLPAYGVLNPFFAGHGWGT